MRLLRLAYNVVFPIVFLALLPGFLWRMARRGKYRHKFGQRFAIYSPRVRRRLGGASRTWVHAVSVGEVLIATKLIRRLRERDPRRKFVLSTTTSTGFALAGEQRSEWLEPVYNPLDFPGIVGRAVRTLRPDLLVLIEAEVWPNLVSTAKAAGAPVVLANARLSPRSYARFRAVRRVARLLFNSIDAVCVQEIEDAARWRSIGVDESRIRLTGSIKFDDATAAPRTAHDFWPLLDRLAVGRGSPVVVAGSTHRGEEALLARAVARLRRRAPDLFFVCVPRHFERCAEVRHELESLGLRVVLRSEIGSADSRPDVLLVNTTGELRDWYRCATVAFVGKSLTASGGQNPVEAVAEGCAVVVGPNMQNFAALVRELVRADGIVQAPDAAALERALLDLLDRPARRAELAANALKALEAHRGATDRTCDIIESLRGGEALR